MSLGFILSPLSAFSGLSITQNFVRQKASPGLCSNSPISGMFSLPQYIYFYFTVLFDYILESHFSGFTF